MESTDPLMPAQMRFPMVSPGVRQSEEPRSNSRPFVLRDATAPQIVEYKHRTPSRPTRIPQTTHRDNRVDDDSYSVPDD